MTEADPNGLIAGDAGAKLDAGKAPLFQGVFSYFPRALAEVAKVSGFGAKKYSWGGWRTVENGIERYADALSRHVIGEVVEGEHDVDSGLMHAAHAAWNALAVLELKLKQKAERVSAVVSRDV